MKKQTALKIILALATGGMLFSGYLSYTELFRNVCSIGGCSMVIGMPACVYGFVMYLVAFIIAVLGLRSKN